METPHTPPIQNSNVEMEKEEWKKFSIAFWVMWFISSMIRNIYVESLEELRVIIYGSFFINILLSILIGYYTVKLTNKKGYIFLGLLGLSPGLGIVTYFIIWKMRSNKIKKTKPV